MANTLSNTHRVDRKSRARTILYHKSQLIKNQNKETWH